MADETSSRREKLAIKAFDPITGGEMVVYISQDRLLVIGKRSQGQTLEAAYLVPQTLQCHGPVFEGLCSEEDEDRRGVGWRCYCSLPDRSYTQDGERRSPRADKFSWSFSMRIMWPIIGAGTGLILITRTFPSTMRTGSKGDLHECLDER